MTNIPRFVQVFALGAWVGSIFYFSAAVGPGAFRVLSSTDQAGSLIVFTLGRLHLMGVVAALLYLLATMALAWSFKGLIRLELIAVIVMLLLTIFSQQFVMRKMQVLRMQMGSLPATSTSDPLRVEFDPAARHFRGYRWRCAADRPCEAVSYDAQLAALAKSERALQGRKNSISRGPQHRNLPPIRRAWLEGRKGPTGTLLCILLHYGSLGSKRAERRDTQVSDSNKLKWEAIVEVLAQNGPKNA
jgi:hypothetical protein